MSLTPPDRRTLTEKLEDLRDGRTVVSEPGSALAIISQDRDEWKKRALTAEAKVRELEFAIANSKQQVAIILDGFEAMVKERDTWHETDVLRIAELEKTVTSLRDAMVPAQLHCPQCGLQHIDKDEWATRPHRTHECQGCKHLWRPYEVATVGVVGSVSDGMCDLVRDMTCERDGLNERIVELEKTVAEQDKGCTGVIPGTYIACGEGRNFCSDACHAWAMYQDLGKELAVTCDEYEKTIAKLRWRLRHRLDK